MWLILKWYTILEDFFCYIASVTTTLSRRHQKCDWSNLKILMSGWYRKLTSSCVLFPTYQQCHSVISRVMSLQILLQYQNVHWETIKPARLKRAVLEKFLKILLPSKRQWNVIVRIGNSICIYLKYSSPPSVTSQLLYPQRKDEQHSLFTVLFMEISDNFSDFYDAVDLKSVLWANQYLLHQQ